MTNEGLQPKSPIYDKEGKVRDERIAREMAKTEVSMLSKGMATKKAGQEAEHAGLRMYFGEGVAIAEKDVPPNVRDSLQNYAREMFAIGEEDLSGEYVEFRKVSDIRDGTDDYMMECGRSLIVAVSVINGVLGEARTKYAAGIEPIR